MGEAEEKAEKSHPLAKADELIARFGLIPLILVAIGFVLIVAGLGILLRSQSQSLPVTIIEDTSLSPQVVTIRVDIEGAVENPGVYELPSGSRIQEGLIAAGGLANNADRGYVSRVINQAALLSDGGKVYIPSVGETTSGQVQSSKLKVQSGQGNSLLGVSTALININTASSSELESFRGIGPVTAEKIISGRPYQRIEELKERKIVNSKVWEEIREKITIF